LTLASTRTNRLFYLRINNSEGGGDLAHHVRGEFVDGRGCSRVPAAVDDEVHTLLAPALVEGFSAEAFTRRVKIKSVHLRKTFRL